MTRLKDLLDYLDYLDTCSDNQFLKFCDAMEKRGYQFVTQYVLDYDYPHVTHCKDCKHWDGYFCHNPNWGDGYGNYTPPIKAEDGYCDWAERKTQNETD